MAFTATRNYRFAEGNKYKENWTVNCDANSGSFQTGLSVVDGVDGIVVNSAATTCPKTKPNLNSGATATNGFIFMSSCSNGDVYYITVVGH